jgi:hypothetical protein
MDPASAVFLKVFLIEKYIKIILFYFLFLHHQIQMEKKSKKY